MTGIGGYFARLKIEYDQAASDKSKKELKELGEQAKKNGEMFDKFVGDAIKGLIGLGVAATGSAYAVSNIQGKMALTAKTAGMSYNELNRWSAAFKNIGLDAGPVASKMADVTKAFSDYKIGLNPEAYETLSKDLALMGISVGAFEKMSPTERILAVAGKAEAARGTEKERGFIDLADKILGIGDMLIREQLPGTKYKTAKAVLAGAGAWESNAAGITQTSESFNALTTQMDQMWKSFGETMGTTFKPIIDDLTKFIKDHKDEIQGFFKDLSNLLSDTITLLAPSLEAVVGTVGKQVHENAETARMIKWQKEHPQDYLRLEEAIRKTGKTGIEIMGKPIGGNVSTSDALLYAKQIEERGTAYFAPVSDAVKKQFADKYTNSSVTVGDINLYGDDANQYLNYMKENPEATKMAAAVAALAATNEKMNTMGLTK